MSSAGNTHETFGRPDQVIKAFAECKGDDTIVFAVNYQHVSAQCRGYSGDQPRRELLTGFAIAYLDSASLLDLFLVFDT